MTHCTHTTHRPILSQIHPFSQSHLPHSSPGSGSVSLSDPPYPSLLPNQPGIAQIPHPVLWPSPATPVCTTISRPLQGCPPYSPTHSPLSCRIQPFHAETSTHTLQVWRRRHILYTVPVSVPPDFIPPKPFPTSACPHSLSSAPICSAHVTFRTREVQISGQK